MQSAIKCNGLSNSTVFVWKLRLFIAWTMMFIDVSPTFAWAWIVLQRQQTQGDQQNETLQLWVFHGCILDITVQSDITRTGLFNRPQWGFYDLRGYSNKLASDLARQMEIPEKHRASKIGQSWTTMGICLLPDSIMRGDVTRIALYIPLGPDS